MPFNHFFLAFPVFGPNLYRHFSTPRTQPNARSACLALGSSWDLVSIRSAEENSFVHSLTSDPTAIRWIGIVRRSTGSRLFKYLDTGQTITFSQWNPGTSEPNNLGGNEDCVQMGHVNFPDQNWNDARCSLSREYVCKSPWG